MKVYQLQTNAEKIDDFFNNEENCLLDIINVLPTSFDIQVKDLEQPIHYNVAAANQRVCTQGVSFDSDDTINLISGLNVTIAPDPVMKTVVIESMTPANQTIFAGGTFDEDAIVDIVSGTNKIVVYKDNNNNLYVGGSYMSSFLEITDITNGIYTIRI